jgi:DNA-binding transcriptional ArsR family regulator
MEMDTVFKALADGNRRRLLGGLNNHNGQTLREPCAGLNMTRQAASKHLAVLEAANLITTVGRGREKLHYLNAVPINDIAERCICQYDQERVRALADLKHALEDTPVNNPQFVYVTVKPLIYGTGRGVMTPRSSSSGAGTGCSSGGC